MAKKSIEATEEEDGFVNAEVLLRHVFHDGTSMIVLKPDKSVRIERKFIAGLVEDGIIAKPHGSATAKDDAVPPTEDDKAPA